MNSLYQFQSVTPTARQWRAGPPASGRDSNPASGGTCSVTLPKLRQAACLPVYPSKEGEAGIQNRNKWE
jgi:hypothetical protein